MKIFGKILLSAILFIFCFSFVNAENIKWLNNLSSHSSSKEEINEKIKNSGINAINYARTIFSLILVVLIIYAWSQMVMFSTDEDSVSKSKRTLWYSIVWVIFINFPVSLYYALVSDSGDNSWKGNFFINRDIFIKVTENILTGIEILLVSVCVFVLVLEWIKLIANSKNPENFTKSIEKVKWVVVWLVFLWFIELWKIFLKTWNTESWINNIFRPVAELLLYLAWPVALFFLSLAGYYYIFSNWDEDKAKKWKSIIINTSIWIIIILFIYVILNDLNKLNF